MVIHSEFLDSLGPSSIRSITAKIRDKASEGIKVVSFAGGLPSSEFFPTKELKEITEAILEDEGGEAIQYAASDGYDPLRMYLAKFMERYQVYGLTHKNILITSGAQQGLAYLSRGLITPGAVVVTENPSYPGALDTFRACGAKIVGVKMERDGMDMEMLESVLKNNRAAFIYTIADFQNPMGVSMSIEKRKKLIALAEQYDTFVVEDGPYSLISFNDSVMPAIKSFDTNGRVIYSGSTSKTIAPGLRIGWLAADEDSIRKLVYLKMRDDLQVNNIAQRQVLRYMRDYDFDGHLQQVIQVYKRRRDIMVHGIQENFPEGTNIVLPEGGLFLWVALPKKINTLEAFDYVFKENIAYVPGGFFCTDGGGWNTMRLNFSTVDETKIAEYIPVLGRMMKDYLSREK